MTALLVFEGLGPIGKTIASIAQAPPQLSASLVVTHQLEVRGREAVAPRFEPKAPNSNPRHIAKLKGPNVALARAKLQTSEAARDSFDLQNTVNIPRERRCRQPHRVERARRFGLRENAKCLEMRRVPREEPFASDPTTVFDPLDRRSRCLHPERAQLHAVVRRPVGGGTVARIVAGKMFPRAEPMEVPRLGELRLHTELWILTVPAPPSPVHSGPDVPTQRPFETAQTESIIEPSSIHPLRARRSDVSIGQLERIARLEIDDPSGPPPAIGLGGFHRPQIHRGARSDLPTLEADGPKLERKIDGRDPIEVPTRKQARQVARPNGRRSRRRRHGLVEEIAVKRFVQDEPHPMRGRETLPQVKVHRVEPLRRKARPATDCDLLERAAARKHEVIGIRDVDEIDIR